MQSVLEVHQKIETESAQKNHQEVRTITKMKIGQAIRQGDVYLTKIKSVPKAYTMPTMNLQVAEGTTKGSRHILSETPSMKIFKNPNAGPLEGPVVTCKETFSLTHPEHADFCFVGGGTFAITYQQDFAREEIMRVRD